MSTHTDCRWLVVGCNCGCAIASVLRWRCRLTPSPSLSPLQRRRLHQLRRRLHLRLWKVRQRVCGHVCVYVYTQKDDRTGRQAGSGMSSKHCSELSSVPHLSDAAGTVDVSLLLTSHSENAKHIHLVQLPSGASVCVRALQKYSVTITHLQYPHDVCIVSSMCRTLCRVTQPNHTTNIT